MSRSYGKRIGGFKKIRSGLRSMDRTIAAGKRRLKGDNPHIRRKYQENREINLEQEWEVRHAESIGAIKISKNGAISPVKGRTYVKNGRLYYTPATHAVAKNTPHNHEENREVTKSGGRKVDDRDRSVWSSNAMKGTKKWHLMPHSERVDRRAHPKGNWGFEGRSPNTRNRK
jgi:hypothetical protein